MFDQWLLIGTLAVSTYLSRAAGVMVMAARKLNPTLRLYFNYLPIAIITALIVKQVLVPSEGHLVLSLPVLVACLIASVSIKITKMFLPSVVLGIAAGLLWRFFF